MWKWTTRKISNVSLMIAVAVVFVLIGSLLFAITAYPSFKISFAGLPVKLAGYFLGPLVGAITGFITDIISFIFLPTFYHPGYSLSLAIAGMVPGIIMWIMIKTPRSFNTHFFTTLTILLIIWVFLFVFFWVYGNPNTTNKATGNLPLHIKNFIQHRWLYLLLGVGGISANIILLFIFRFCLKPQNFIIIAPIMLFLSISGVINAFLMPEWDKMVLGIPYKINLMGHYLLLLPIKLWFNIAIIYFSWKVLNPIMQKSTKNYWR